MMHVQQIYLSPIWMLTVDILAWFLFHMGISLTMLKVSDHFFIVHESWFRTFKWEENGMIWQKIFRIQSWKKFLPDGSIFFKSAYNKTNMSDAYLSTLKKFLLEMRRAELTHWISMIPAIFFFIWNPPLIGWIMVIYAILMNAPFIIVQRYNRPRLQKIYLKKQERERRLKE